MFRLRSPVSLTTRGMRLTACLHTSKDYYQVLGLEQSCTAKDIRSKYVELCKLYHPDTVTSGREKEVETAKKKFQEIQEAYNTLSKESDRRNYDNQRSMYNDFGPSSSGWQRTYQRSSTSSDDHRDPYARAREYHRRRQQAQNNDTDGWSWGEYWKENPFEEERQRRRDERHYETQRQRWEREKDEYARYAREQHFKFNMQLERFAVVGACIALVMIGSLFHATTDGLTEEQFEKERARIIALAEKRRQAQKFDVSDPDDRRYLQMSSEEYARRFR